MWPFGKKKTNNIPVTYDLYLTRTYQIVVSEGIPNAQRLTMQHFTTEDAALDYLFTHEKNIKSLDECLTSELGHWFRVGDKIVKYLEENP